MSEREVNGRDGSAHDAAEGVRLLLAIVTVAVANDAGSKGGRTLDVDSDKAVWECLRTTATPARSTWGQSLPNHSGALEDNVHKNHSGMLGDNHY